MLLNKKAHIRDVQKLSEKCISVDFQLDTK